MKKQLQLLSLVVLNMAITYTERYFQQLELKQEVLHPATGSVNQSWSDVQACLPTGFLYD